MNKKGRQGFMTLLNLIVIIIVFTFLIFQSQKLDIDYLHSTTIVRNLGMVMTTISFTPGNFFYNYMTEDDNKMAKWESVPAQISSNEIKYYRNNTKDQPYKYKFFSNNFLTNDFEQQKEVEIDKYSLNIFKLRDFSLNKKPNFEDLTNLKKLDCTLPSKEDEEIEFYPLHCTDQTSFYTKKGEEIKQKPETNYKGFKKQYFFDNERVYKQTPGLQDSILKESEQIWQIVKMMDPDANEKKCIPQKFLDNKTVLLTLNNKDSDHIIARVPVDNYTRNRKVACRLITNLLNKKEIIEEIEGAAIVPTKQEHIILELGSLSGEIINYKKKIAEALE